jgi:mono/diheme cytochrome c family protein
MLALTVAVSIAEQPKAMGQARSLKSLLQPLLTAHCIDCHKGKDAEGRFDLAALGDDLSDRETARRWVLVHDRMVKGEMPPQAEPRIATAKQSAAIKTLSTALTRADRARSKVVLRRLNRTEYEATIRDLFGIEARVKNMLPKDTPTDGFDNVGEGLAVSAEAMQSYLRAADATLDAVFGPPAKPKYIRHETNLLDQKDHLGNSFIAHRFGKMFRKTKDGVIIFQSNYCPSNLVNFARLRAPAGTYHVKVRVRAIQSKEPVTLRIYGGDTIVGRREMHLVGYYDIPPDKWTTVEFKDRLVEPNGTFLPKCYGTEDTRKDADTYPNPGLEIGDIKIEGPIEEWPPLSRSRLLGEVNPKTATLSDVNAILERVLPRAFRRPVDPGEVAPILSLAKSELDSGGSFEAALRLALKAVLCSPEFLFLEEPRGDVISQHALASRLSYFLWSSMPDEELLSLAVAGKLEDPMVLRAQVDRLLNSPKANAFTVNFTAQWLSLKDIDFTTPDRKLFPEFDELLKISMIEETQHFFQEMLREDLSVMNIVDSDFLIVNERLAKHYDIKGVEGQEFRKVTLPADSVRGGIMTQASILKVTANGSNSSPVIRGIWVLENIMGTPVPPPPPNTPTVEPDIRGATTLREQLAKHRNIDACAVCHAKIDPAGFALENFNVIGGWRDDYRTLGEGRRPDVKRAPFTHNWVSYKLGRPVDATGQTPDGQPFSDIRRFKELLADDVDQITAGLTKKLLTYSMGRTVGFSDRPAIKEIVAKVSNQQYGLRSLVHEIVQSPTFHRP